MLELSGEWWLMIVLYLQLISISFESSLNIHDQVEGLDASGQFRFTPPTHSLVAFRQALLELLEEGGVEARYKRYQANQLIIGLFCLFCLFCFVSFCFVLLMNHAPLTAQGMKKLGFEPYLTDDVQGPIISTFKAPRDDNWNFKLLYDYLNQRDMVIYPGKTTTGDSFRIGHIGHLFPKDSRKLVECMKDAIPLMGLKVKPPHKSS